MKVNKAVSRCTYMQDPVDGSPAVLVHRYGITQQRRAELLFTEHREALEMCAPSLCIAALCKLRGTIAAHSCTSWQHHSSAHHACLLDAHALQALLLHNFHDLTSVDAMHPACSTQTHISHGNSSLLLFS